MPAIFSHLLSLAKQAVEKMGGSALRMNRKFLRTCAVFGFGAAAVTALTLLFSFPTGNGEQTLTVFAGTIEDWIPKMHTDVQNGSKDPSTDKQTERHMENRIQRPEGYGRIEGFLEQEVRARQKVEVLAGESVLKAREEVRAAGEAYRAEKIAEAEIKELAAKEEAAAEASAVVPYTQEDYQVLLKIVEAEAGICDEKGKILVANVILNRVRSGEFPDTITKVVYEPEQFSPVRDGSLESCSVSSQTVECVDRALSGEDYSQGALYFMNRAGSKKGPVTWFDSHLTYIFRHDGHEFYK